MVVVTRDPYHLTPEPMQMMGERKARIAASSLPIMIRRLVLGAAPHKSGHFLREAGG